MILRDSYCEELHIIWLRWRPWLVKIYMDPVDACWVAWTCGYKYVVFRNSPKEALEDIKKEIRRKELK